jgi:hypothetical protein
MSEDARALVVRLLSEARLSPVEISEALGGRVSSRSIYRWAKGETSPQNASDYEALRALVADLPKRGRKPKPEGTPVDSTSEEA